MSDQIKFCGAPVPALVSTDEQRSARCLVRLLLWAEVEAREGLNDHIAAGHIEAALTSLSQRYKIDPNDPV